MKFPVLLITYAFVQISSCIQSDVPAEELVQTSSIMNTSAYPAFNFESETEDVLSSSLPPSSSLVTETHDLSQERFVSTASSNLHLPTVSKITWYPVSSVVLSTDPVAKSPDYENTFPSGSLQNTTQYPGTNTFNYQTAPSFFEYLDHEENELDSDTRVTDMSKGLKTTLNADFPPLHSHKFETIHSTSPTDGPHISHSSVNQVSESENESTSGRTTILNVPFVYNVKNSTVTFSDHTVVEASTSVPVTDYPNLELSTESRETSSIQTRDENMSDSIFFGTTEGTSENLYRNNVNKTVNFENTTLVSDENLKSTSPNVELVTEKQEFNLYSSSLDANSTETESSKDLESVNTISFYEKGTEELELTSRMSLESSTSLFSEQSEQIKMPTLPTDVFNTMNTNNLTSENYSTLSETLPPDISSNTKVSPFTIPTFFDDSLPQNLSNIHIFQNSSQENYMSSVTEITSLHSSFTAPINSSDMEVTTISSLIDKTPLTFSIATESETDVSSNFESNTATDIERSGESVTLTLPSKHFTNYLASSNDGISPTTMSSLDAYSEVVTTSHSSVNIFELTSELSTTTDPNIINRITDKMNYTEMEHDLLTRTWLSTTDLNGVEESKSSTIVSFPSKHIGSESSTDSFTEQSTAPQTVAYHPLLSTIVSSTIDESKSSTVDPLLSHNDMGRESSVYTTTEQGTVSEAVTYPHFSTTFEQSLSSITHNVFSSFKYTHDNKEETITPIPENYSSTTDEIVTSVPDSYSSVATAATTDISHREGKHIPFSKATTVRVTDISSEHGFLLVTTEKTQMLKAPMNDTEVQYMQIQIEDVNLVDRINMITAIIQFPVDSVNKTDMKIKLAKTHQWLDKVLTKDFRNWTRDPFEEVEEQDDEIPFGNISIFYVTPTPETNASHITLTFIVYNAWRNRTLPAYFVLRTLNFYSKELKESINASAVYFYHELSTENYDLMSAVLDKYGIIIFIICLAVVGICILLCVVIFYRKKTRQSIHYLADSKLQQNLQEAVGIDLTPASIILQDEKEEKGNKICDDEGWLVPITDVPVAEDNNVPNVQDTKL